MTHHYKIDILTTSTVLKATYRNKRFVKLELISGKLKNYQLKAIGKAIPPHEEDFGTFNEAFEGKINYTLIVKDETIYQQFVGAWYDFYEGFIGIKPKFTGLDGKHINQIIVYLRRVGGGSDTEALELWKVVLESWEGLDKFHQENTDLKYINSRLNVILNAIKRKNTGSATASGKKVEL